ncbi:RecA-like protein [Synechococcus phage ACG-2014d]|jgi:RecA/RadA recombinase|uniref:RecA-like protein n=1 Tax=Synechococcus phage ACG-2014d TaxID=1493509 RepID=A0A0E3FDU7_9CAUD|nr:recombinase [Synechococcus phage ACG-2014d]YP_010355315.1 recombinase [Synechococcus phage ACG-2014d]AIX14757.1 RecA-like protein [Synechococcus phage ACG-2014d]AIX14976.1 RecA-like protein [Synechococcus phage ACG-2014d]AIX15403.1 RecA-like protein [Synechococcus phage ACG-2014d]AIX15622.1 RecA-like protein [Synechococcus phage ACG-2014d]AIX16051.1 RecA-like protein [Synechococcus phage ACG-2014d]
MNFLQDIVKDLGNEYAGLVSDGVAAGDTSGFIDTGSHIFNALVSGSIYGGVPGNKITAIAGESSTGKTFFCLGIVQHFLESNPNAGVIYFESESAISRSMIEDRGIDSNRMMIVPVSTIEEFRTQACRILDKYMEQPKDERQPMMFVLDSLGMLSTSKEMQDVADDKQVRDMTKSQLIKGAFRVLTLKLGKADVPMLVTNHTYDVIGAYHPTKEMGGGSGLKYASSTIIYLSKKKEKDGTEVVGNIIKCKAQKSRLTKENSQIETRLYYDRGLDKYYGLLELGERAGMWKNVAGRYEMNGKKVYAKAILKDPDTYFTAEVMQALDEAAQKEFMYGA